MQAVKGYFIKVLPIKDGDNTAFHLNSGEAKIMSFVNKYSVLAHRFAAHCTDPEMSAQASHVRTKADLIRFASKFLRGRERMEMLRLIQKMPLADWEAKIVTGETYSIDGSTVRKHGTQNLKRRTPPLPESVVFEFWTDDCLTPNEEVELREAVELLLEGAFKIENIQEPVRGSFYQLFKIRGLRKYLSSVFANLQSAFSAAVTNQNAEAILKFSKIIEKHENIVVHAEDIIAIKFTRDRQSYVLIERVPPHLKEALARDQTLRTNPSKIYDLFHCPDNVVPLPMRPAIPAPTDVAETLPVDSDPDKKTRKTKKRKA